MNLAVRIFHIVFFGLLLAALTASTILYFQHESPDFRQRIEEWEWAKAGVDWASWQFTQYEIQPRWGIGLVLVLVVLYLAIGFFKQKNWRPPSGFTLFIINIVVIFAAGLVSAIYFWPSDVIKLGIFDLNRGSPQKFLDSLIQIGLIVVLVHLFLFLIVNWWRWTFCGWRIRPVYRPGETKKYRKEEGA